MPRDLLVDKIYVFDAILGDFSRKTVDNIAAFTEVC